MRSGRSVAGVVWPGKALIRPRMLLTRVSASGLSSPADWPCHRPYSIRKKPVQPFVAVPLRLPAASRAVDLHQSREGVVEGAVRGAEPLVVEVRGQPVGLGLRQVPGLDVRVQLLGRGEQAGQPRLHVRAVLVDRRLHVLLVHRDHRGQARTGAGHVVRGGVQHVAVDERAAEGVVARADRDVHDLVGARRDVRVLAVDVVVERVDQKDLGGAAAVVGHVEAERARGRRAPAGAAGGLADRDLNRGGRRRGRAHHRDRGHGGYRGDGHDRPVHDPARLPAVAYPDAGLRGGRGYGSQAEPASRTRTPSAKAVSTVAR